MLATLLLLALAPAVHAAANLPPIPEDRSTPFAQRLALQVDPTTIKLGWNTYQKLNQSCVSYGTSPDALTNTACAGADGSVTYPSSRMWSNAVTLTGLQAGQQYYYRVQSTNTSTPTLPFRAGRSAGDATPFAVNAVIDLGVYGADGYTISEPSQKALIPRVLPSNNHTTIGRLLNTLDDYEFVIHPGDLAYADDWFERGNNLFDGANAFEAILEQFYDQLDPISSRKPYMVSPGNHEADCKEVLYTPGSCPEGQSNFTDFNNRFGRLMPTASPSTSSNDTARTLRNRAAALAQPPFWFSFDYGMAHITFIDTETDFANAPDAPGGSQNLYSGPFGAPGQQQAFLEADLAGVDRTVTPWVIVAGHRPWYSTGGSGNRCKPCQAAFESTLYKYGVDLAIFGHVHNSQRFQPTFNNTADPAGLNNPKAPWYAVAGGSGNIEGLSSVGDKPGNTAFAYADDYSFATITFHNRTNLGLKFTRSSDGSVLDKSTLYKKHDVSFVDQSP